MYIYQKQKQKLKKRKKTIKKEKRKKNITFRIIIHRWEKYYRRLMNPMEIRPVK